MAWSRSTSSIDSESDFERNSHSDFFTESEGSEDSQEARRAMEQVNLWNEEFGYFQELPLSQTSSTISTQLIASALQNKTARSTEFPRRGKEEVKDDESISTESLASLETDRMIPRSKSDSDLLRLDYLDEEPMSARKLNR